MAAEQDIIGPWSEVKLEILGKYATPYSKIVTAQGFHHMYIEASRAPARTYRARPVRSCRVVR